MQRVGQLPATPSPLLRRRGLGRRLDTLDVPLDGLRAAASAAGCSVNDAYLAGVCGGLRRYHEDLGVPVDDMTVAIPVSRRTDDDPVGGNRFTATRFAAPVGVADPLERMRRIHEIVLPAVNEPAIDAFGSVAPALSHLPMALLGALRARGNSTDVQASNVRSYPDSPYVAGAQVLKSYWFGPLLGVAVMVVLLSQAGTCHLGIQSDTAAVPDGERFSRCLREGFDEVLAVASTPPTAAKQAAAKRPAARKAPAGKAPAGKAPAGKEEA
jgi:hypothetical protein